MYIFPPLLLFQYTKNNNKDEKQNYRPVSILPNLSKIYEKLMYKQLFPSQCGFRKGYSVQHCLPAMIEKCKEAIERGSEFGALLTDLSKTFVCTNHQLLVAKLHNYEVPPLSITMIFFLFEESNQNQ